MSTENRSAENAAQTTESSEPFTVTSDMSRTVVRIRIRSDYTRANEMRNTHVILRTKRRQKLFIGTSQTRRYTCALCLALSMAKDARVQQWNNVRFSLHSNRGERNIYRTEITSN